VILNLQGSPLYQPNLPWVRKVRAEDNNKIAYDFVSYVDDLLSAGNSRSEARLASRKISSTLNWLGLQDASRKWRGPSQNPGAWAGSIVHTAGGDICLSVSQERWDKGHVIRGFLVYLMWAYPSITPYLKGIHLTLDSKRPSQGDDGWELTMREIQTTLEGCGDSASSLPMSENIAPSQVKWVLRLVDDITQLLELFDTLSPPQQHTIPSQRATTVYGFGDALGSVFSSSLLIAGKVCHSSAKWNANHLGESSTYRELSDLVY